MDDDNLFFFHPFRERCPFSHRRCRRPSHQSRIFNRLDEKRVRSATRLSRYFWNVDGSGYTEREREREARWRKISSDYQPQEKCPIAHTHTPLYSLAAARLAFFNSFLFFLIFLFFIHLVWFHQAALEGQTWRAGQPKVAVFASPSFSFGIF